VNLSLNRRGDYALRAALHLAEAWESGGYVKIRDVATAMALPMSYTPQVLGLLARAGIAEAKVGPGGGYRLAKRPEEISVLDVVQAAEGDLRSTTCILRGGPCRWESVCAAHEFWARASDAFIESLAGASLRDLAAVDSRMTETGSGAGGPRRRRPSHTRG
jgi:Rrf2 family protein